MSIPVIPLDAKMVTQVCELRDQIRAQKTQIEELEKKKREAQSRLDCLLNDAVASVNAEYRGWLEHHGKTSSDDDRYKYKIELNDDGTMAVIVRKNR